MVLGSHEEVAGLGWVVRCLLGDVVSFGAVWVVPVASEDLAQDGIEWLFNAPSAHLATVCLSHAAAWGRTEV